MKINMNIKNTANLITILIVTYFVWTVCASLIAWVGAYNTFLAHAKFGDFLFDNPFIRFDIYYNQQVIDPKLLNLSGSAATIGFMGSILYLTFMGYIVMKSLTLSELFKQGRVFSLRHTALFKSISMAIFLMGSIAMVVSEMCTGLALSFDQGIGQRIIQIGFGTPNLTIMFWSSTGYLISHIMQQGTDLYDDQQLVICVIQND